MKLTLTKPTLILNSEIARRNIQKMKLKAEMNNCIFRPHFKTHQSAEVGEWFKAEGIYSCTVSSVQMAKYFVDNGWKDITIAFPFNILEAPELNLLASSSTINICVESVESVELLHNLIEFPLGVFIKIDAGYHRTGVYSDHLGQLEEIIKEIEKGSMLTFKGFLQHAGHSYHVKNTQEVEAIHQHTLSEMVKLKNSFSGNYPNLIISVGDTPTCSICEDFSKVDEMRPGNFVFYDLMQHRIGACSREEIAVIMACPIVALHPDREEVIIYGGAVHFSKDHLIEDDGNKIFGQIADSQDPWNRSLANCYIKKLSQEHGTIHMDAKRMNNLQVGDIIYCLPVHSCLTANLMNSYLTTEGQRLSMFRFQ